MKNQKNEIVRREFLKRSAQYVAASLIVGLGSSKLFGAISADIAKQSIPTVRLNNGVLMPMLGFGTNTLNGPICVRCVSDAIAVGYRLIDTARIYGNEEFVGEGIKQSGINREELFVTSKLWVDDSGYEGTKKAFETTIAKLGLAYLDLYLIHRPRGDVKGSWKAMEELYREGKIKAIGVSNFEPAQLSELMGYASIKPAINQIETHVFFQQHMAYEFLKQSEVQMQGWSPFAAARNDIFTNQTLANIGKKHNKSIVNTTQFPEWD
jgi:2,5-diketo-D-gluconate reductase A